MNQKLIGVEEWKQAAKIADEKPLPKYPIPGAEVEPEVQAKLVEETEAHFSRLGIDAKVVAQYATFLANDPAVQALKQFVETTRPDASEDEVLADIISTVVMDALVLGVIAGSKFAANNLEWQEA